MKQPTLSGLVVSRLLQLNAIAYGVVAGLFLGIAVFIATIWLLVKGGDVVGPHLGLLGQYFFGYDVTGFGSIIGLAYGFFYGFLAGYLAALIYNAIVNAIGEKGSS